MITTAEPLLQELSEKLNETSTDTSTKRLGYFYESVRQLLNKYKWGWSIKPFTITLLANISEYNLSTLISDYSPSWGIDEVLVGGHVIDPVPFESRSSYSSDTRFYITRDNKTLGFTRVLATTEVVVVNYYARIIRPAEHDDTLNISLPDDIGNAIVLYMKHLVHDGKRQRLDARNALTDWKEELDSLRPQEASQKAKYSPRTVPNVLAASKFRRTYR